MVAEAFARRFSLTLATRLRIVADVRPAGIHQMTQGEFVASLPDPTCLTVANLPPLEGAGVLHLSLPFALELVDRLCGGSGTQLLVDRRLTEIETTLLAGATENALSDLAAAFSTLAPFAPVIVRHEDQPQLLKTAASSCPVLLMSLVVTTKQSEGALQFCLPFSAIERSLDDFNGGVVGGGTTGETPAGLVAAALMETSVDVSVRFMPLTLTPEEILSLAVGDVMALNHPLDSPLALTASEVPFLATLAGRRGRRLACQVVGCLQEKNR